MTAQPAEAARACVCPEAGTATFPCDLGRGGPLAGPPPTRPGASSPWPLPSQAGKPRSFLGPSSSPHSCCTGSVRLGGDPSGCQWEESWVGAVTPPVGKWTRGSRNGISPKPCSGSRGEDERGRGFGGKKRGAWPDRDLLGLAWAPSAGSCSVLFAGTETIRSARMWTCQAGRGVWRPQG